MWGRRAPEHGTEFDEAPRFPQFNDLPAAVDPMRRRWTDKVLEAGQYVNDLEAKVASQAEELGFERNHNRLLTEAKDLLRREVGGLKTENQQIREVLARTRTKLEVGAQLYLEALQELNKLGIQAAPAAAEEPAAEPQPETAG